LLITSSDITVVHSPLRVHLGKNKYFILNQNAYRNAHFRVLAKAKVNYTQIMQRQIQSIGQFQSIEVTYKIYHGSKRKFDLGNVMAVQSKFFLDALVHWGAIVDDTYEYVTKETVIFGGVDKDDPRVEITIKESE